MTNGYPAGESRRQAVRVEDRVLLSVSPVTPEKYASLEEDFKRGIPPYIQDGLSDIQMYVGTQTSLARIESKDEDLGRFLRHLDTKINMVLQKLSGDRSPFENLTMREVTISSTGISFQSKEAMNKEAKVELNIVLLPDSVYIYCLGEVVGCKKNTADGCEPFSISCKFSLIMEEDREKLMEHNFKTQSLALRNRRRARE